MTHEELPVLDLEELSGRIRSGDLSPVRLVEACLDRIRRLDPTVNAFITVMGEQALAEARRSEGENARGKYRGPLHGIPIAVKDLFDTQGVRTTAASRLVADRVPDRDSAVVERLRGAGAIVIGKTNLHEFAYGMSGDSSFFGPTHNPWNTGRAPGGSSGGSGAALAAGMCPLALGTDTGGSIRIPAALCGVVGIKPTFGRVSCRGVLPLAWSLDHAGPMARDVFGVASLLQVIAGYDEGDPASADEPVSDYTSGLGAGIGGLRIGFDPTWTFEHVTPDVAASFREALRTLGALGAQVSEVRIPCVGEATDSASAILMSEATAIHEHFLSARADEYQPDVRSRLQKGFAIRGIDYGRARRAGELAKRELAALLRSVDLIASPTTAMPAPEIGAREVEVDGDRVPPLVPLGRFTRVFNISGLPAVSVPCGFSREGLPLGLQLAGRAFDEATVLRAAAAFECATDWHRRRPDI